MSISKLIIAIILGVALPASALAQQAPAQGADNSSVKLDVTDFFTAVDTSKDGSVSLDEFKAAGLNEAVFSVFDKDKKNTFTKDAMGSMTHPAAIDANKDGKLSLEEFKTFTKDVKAQSGAPGAAPGGAAPGGAAPAGAPAGAPAK